MAKSSVIEEDLKVVSFKVSNKTFERMRAKAKSEGILSISEYMRTLVIRDTATVND